MQQYIAGKENHNHEVWERAYIRGRKRRSEGSDQMFRWGCFGKYVIKLLSFTEKHPIPTFSLQTEEHTLSKVTN